MGTAAPDAPAEAEKPARASRHRRRVRIPTPVVVTFIGIAVSAWLFPALTRQWDDRQKAHELSASIVSQMAVATAAALSAGQDGLFSRDRQSRRAPKEWTARSIQIEARLAAYYPQSIVDGWRVETDIVGGMLERLLTPQAPYAGLPTASDARLRAMEAKPPFAASVEGIYEVANAQLDYAAALRVNGAVEDAGGLLEGAYRRQERRLLVLEQLVASDVLRASPMGYSTTAGDFFHDLIP